ncbi:MAG: adenine phosphoribosyltransferase [Chloroflexi bacterium]|nr:adenine phosphoribosyltransferase [Chloroflexota bacterium]
MTGHRETYTVELCGLSRDLPLFEVAPGVRIAIFNILGDTEIVQATSRALAERLPQDADVLITAEVKSIPLAYQLAVDTGLPYVIARKSRKPYMGEALSEEVLSITTGKLQTLWLDEKDLALLKGKRVVIVDDVVSTGSTLEGMRRLVQRAGGAVVAEAAVFTEGNDPEQWQGIIALGNLPVFLD